MGAFEIHSAVNNDQVTELLRKLWPEKGRVSAKKTLVVRSLWHQLFEQSSLRVRRRGDHVIVVHCRTENCVGTRDNLLG